MFSKLVAIILFYIDTLFYMLFYFESLSFLLWRKEPFVNFLNCCMLKYFGYFKVFIYTGFYSIHSSARYWWFSYDSLWYFSFFTLKTKNEYFNIYSTWHASQVDLSVPHRCPNITWVIPAFSYSKEIHSLFKLPFE